MSTDWRTGAACLQHDPETFFPTPGQPGAAQQLRDAQRICGGCSVRIACLDDALAFGDAHGVRGGLGEKELEKLLKDSGRRAPLGGVQELAPCGTISAYNRHRRNREKACEACLSASRRQSREDRARRIARGAA